MTGLVADISRASTHDGPGLRTVVFLKGCPLHCAWCHNPECIAPHPEELYYPERCIGCGKCHEGCYAGARVVCGREMTVEAVMETVLADRRYYGDTGGLTVTGGEPLMQKEFTHALLADARREGIRTAVETSFVIYDEAILRLCDLIMFDLKLPEDERHLQYTGVPVTPIKKNIQRAAALDIPMWGRTPIVPGVNADRNTVGGISAFLQTLPAVKKYELLPYHPLGLTKAHALGREQTRFAIPEKSLMKELSQYAFLR